MSDNEDATTSLGYSEVLSVKSSVGEPIPEFLKSGQETGECVGLVCVVLIKDHTFIAVDHSQRTERRTRIGRCVGS